VAYGILLIFFPKNAIARLYDRSDQRKYQILRRLFGLVLVILWLILVILTPLKIGDVVFMMGISMFSLGLIGFLIALVNFKNTPVDQPVTSGLYRISRHPQQLAVSVSFLGISIAIGSWLAFAFIVLGVIGAHYKILAEEEACLEQYGESYKDYMERIPRYFLFF
jgi:protein-S-isoprenylcysteine O-methyltransferase Ste14